MNDEGIVKKTISKTGNTRPKINRFERQTARQQKRKARQKKQERTEKKATISKAAIITDKIKKKH